MKVDMVSDPSFTVISGYTAQVRVLIPNFFLTNNSCNNFLDLE